MAARVPSGSVIVGRGPELAVVDAALDAARAGRSAALVLEGEAGIGKTTLLDAAWHAADGFLRVRSTGVATDLELGYAALLDVLLPLRDSLDAVPGPQREALEAALGWSGGAAGDPYLVAAGTLSVLAAAAEARPLLVVVDDLQWVDRQSRVALTFAARRLAHDPVAILLARRPGPAEDVAGLPRCPVAGLSRAAAAELLSTRVAANLVDPLLTATGGNPLALGEVVRGLTAEQRRGSAALPDVLPVGERIAAAYGAAHLSPAARRALLLVAASPEQDAGPVVAALGADADPALDEAERAGLLVVETGTLTFPHPLVRAAVWTAAAPADRRSAHAALAAVSARPDRAVRHRAEATPGHDEELALKLVELAAGDRQRRGYAAASALQERAARLDPDPLRAAAARAVAVEDALLAGDVRRVATLGAEVLAAPAADPDRARVLLTLGILEQYAGSVPRAREVLTEAAELGSGEVLVRALSELALVSYRLALPGAMAEISAALDVAADPADPEQELIACAVRSTARAFGGDWAGALEPGLRALEMLESDPVVRAQPRLYLWGIAAGWTGEVVRGMASADELLGIARARGALGVLPQLLSLFSGGNTVVGRHDDAYAQAGEAVELGTELGFVADVAISYEILAWEQAARGLHEDAARSLAEARRLGEVAGVTAVAVQVHLVDAFAAFCRGDLDRVVEVLERRIAADEGRQARGDYPLGVAPMLAEAYLGLGRRADAEALATRHAALHRDSAEPDAHAQVLRLDGLLAADDDMADRAFAAAGPAHADAFEAAWTVLLHGARLRRAGRRTEARVRLREAADAFAALGLDGWAERARSELAATGQTARRGPREGDPLSSQETRVALLVARGLANREIAAALFLSPRTVEHHVTSVLRKRGFRSRTEVAAAFAAGVGKA